MAGELIFHLVHTVDHDLDTLSPSQEEWEGVLHMASTHGWIPILGAVSD